MEACNVRGDGPFEPRHTIRCCVPREIRVIGRYERNASSTTGDLSEPADDELRLRMNEMWLKAADERADRGVGGRRQTQIGIEGKAGAGNRSEEISGAGR